MIDLKRTVFANGKLAPVSPSKRFIALILVMIVSTLFYGFTPSASSKLLTSVTIVCDGEVFEVETRGTTVSRALTLARIDVGEDDFISKSKKDKIADGDVIFVRRLKTILLDNEGTVTEIKTTESTVGDALLANGYSIGKYDEVIPDVNTPVEDGLAVSITKVNVEIYEVTEEIPYSVKTVENAEKETGYREVIQEGKPGVFAKTYKKIEKDGKLTATLIGEHTKIAPIEEIVEIGTKKVYIENSIGAKVSVTQGASLTPGTTPDGVPFHAMPAMAQSNSVTRIEGNTAYTASGTFTFKKRITVEATAYEGSSASNGKWAGMTATGRAPVYGVVAVDPRVIPLNSKLYIESPDGGASWIYGFAIAGDTGGAIKNKRVDLCYNTLSQCYSFGRRGAVVYVLD